MTDKELKELAEDIVKNSNYCCIEGAKLVLKLAKSLGYPHLLNNNNNTNTHTNKNNKQR